MFDIDGDGVITLDELKAAFNGSIGAEKDEKVWGEILAEVDVDGDGNISFKEFEDHMFAVLQKRASFYDGAK